MGCPLPGLPGAALSGGQLHVLGVRHHGPGSARAVAAALDQLDPEVVVIEGAPELDGVAALARSPAMRPPVAPLVYVPDEPRRAVFYPLARFSPEWVALRWALERDRPVRFADLPAAHYLASSQPPPGPGGAGSDPIGTLAAAAGYDDPERWWEDAVEHRHQQGLDAFAALAEAIGTLRHDQDSASGALEPRDSENERREAAMRRVLRPVVAQHATVAMVCGAWHAPALVRSAWPPAAADTRLLRGLPRVKVAATWVPWTATRLATASGYGAGVTSPGWYAHLFSVPDQPVARWLVRTAHLLRDEGLAVSPDSVVEATRLATALATLRGRPQAGLAECLEATEAVLCGGSPVPLRLVERRLVVGDDLGAVPDETPMVPLARDLASTQRRLRLHRRATETALELDLRHPLGRQRSALLHRLRLLGIAWGEPVERGRSTGSFKEEWALQWEPEMDVAVIEASGTGTTVASAANATVAGAAEDASIDQLCTLISQALLADLPDTVAALVATLASRAALAHDVGRLMAAVDPLARVTRYSDVRGTDRRAVGAVLAGIVTRIAIGLGAAAANLDDQAAGALRDGIDGVTRGLGLLDEHPALGEWRGALAALSQRPGVHGLVAGRVNRLLLDGGQITGRQAAQRLGHALSVGTEAASGADWIEGFVAGDALLLLHDPELLGVIDGWMTEISEASFDDALPLLRRAFSAFSPPERRLLGQRVHRSLVDASLQGAAPGTGPESEAVDPRRAALATDAVRVLLGLEGASR